MINTYYLFWFFSPIGVLETENAVNDGILLRTTLGVTGVNKFGVAPV